MGLGKKANPQGSSGFNFSIRLLQLLGQSVDFSSKAATESTLLSVLNAIEISKDFELLLVRDQGDGDIVIQQIRERDQGTGTWVTRYEKVDGSPHTVVGPLKYLDPSAILNLILTELNDQGLTLDDILSTIHLEVDDNFIASEQELPTNINLLYGAYDGEGYEWNRIEIDNEGQLKGIETLKNTLDSLNNKLNVLGQKASAASAPVVLSTEQEALLDSIKTAVENIDLDLGTGGLNLEATQLLVKAVLDTIKLDTAGILTNTADIETLLTTIDADTSNIDVLLSTRATEATLLLVKGVLDSIKVDTAAIDGNTDGLEALLTTIDAVLDSIKLDTAKLDVNLSTRATEATLLSVLTELQGINLDTNGLSQEATQLLVKGVLDTIDAVLDSIKLDTGAMVIDLAAIEVLITSTNSLLTTIDGVLDAIKLDTANLDVTLSSRLNTLGQKASIASAPVVLSTEQEAILNAIKVATEAINLDADGLALDATVLATNALLTTIDTVLDTIKTDTAALVVDAAAIEALLITIDAVIDAIKVDTGNIAVDTAALVVDLAAIEVLITSTNALLSTIDADTSAIAVDIAAIETELLDQGTTLDAIATDAAAIEVELLDQGTSLDAMVTDLAAIETELLDQGTVLDTIDADTSALATPVTNVAMGLIRATDATGSPIAAGKRRISVYNAGAANGSILGVAGNIKPGESLTFSADGLRDTLAAFAYDGTGTELVITTIG